MSAEYTDKQVKDAIIFVIKDNPNKLWSDEELYKAVDNHLLEDTVIENMEKLVKEGLIEEIAPDQFVVTKKGKELEELWKGEKK
jgi:predicted transcriptional regulator